MSTIKRKKGKIAIIKDFFGFRPGDKATDFMEEIKALSAEERLELAQDAAKVMGISQDTVDFELS